MTLSAPDTRTLEAVCQQYGIARLEVFGSVARDEETSTSDIDLLYTLTPGTRLGWEIEDLVQNLESILGRQIDLISKKALNPIIRDAVLAEAKVLYAAQ